MYPCRASGRGCGDGGGRVERVDRWLADEEAEHVAQVISFQAQPIPIGAAYAVLLVGECLATSGLRAHQSVDAVAAAEPVHDVEQLVPEGAVAESRYDSKIEADIADGAANRAAAHLTLEVLESGHEELGIIPASGA